MEIDVNKFLEKWKEISPGIYRLSSALTRLKAAIGESLISNGDVRIIANDLVEDSLVGKLINFGIVGNVGLSLEFSSIFNQGLASVLVVRHHASVERPVVGCGLKSSYGLLVSDLRSCGCAWNSLRYWSEAGRHRQVWAWVWKLGKAIGSNSTSGTGVVGLRCYQSQEMLYTFGGIKLTTTSVCLRSCTSSICDIASASISSGCTSR